MIRVLVSSCLLGERVRYHGGDARLDDPWLATWASEGRIVAFCPEVAGGLPTPRSPAEIRQGDGLAVLGGTARVVTRDEKDVTDAFLQGAELALAAARREGVRLAVLTERSPSCGSDRIYDGSFRGTLMDGAGVTAARLERAGIRVFPASGTGDAAAYLETLLRGVPE